MNELVTSTMAVKTELMACEPDFHVPNPIAGIELPLKRLNDCVFGSCGLTFCAMIFNEISVNLFVMNKILLFG